MSGETKERLDVVQFLRATAAVAVVTSHVPLLGNGVWGVDIFFIISGFIMCYVTEKSGRQFFFKRIIRIAPVYWAMTLGVVAIAAVAPSLCANTTANAVELIKSLLFIPFERTRGDGVVVAPIIWAGWTLNFEMFFYLNFALSMKVSHHYRGLICSAALLTFIIAGRLILAFTPVNSLFVKFYSDTILIEFIFGMICYWAFLKLLPSRHYRSSRRNRLPTLILGAALIALMPLAGVAAPELDRVLRWGLLAMVSFILITDSLYGVALPRPIVMIGDASYSLYLFHAYVLIAIFKVFKAPAGSFAAIIITTAAIVFCCGLSVISFKYLEKPVTDFLRQKLLH